MKRQPQLSYRARALAAPVALLFLLLPATVAAQHGGGHGGSHGGSHHGGGHHSGSHHSGGHRSGAHHGGGYHSGGHLSFYFHRHGYPYYYGSTYPYYGGYGGSYGSAYPGAGAMGALDLDVRPGRTAVYLDGTYIGRVDDYDGYPSYLWLPPGTVELVFDLDGERTMVGQYAVRPGQIASVREDLERGDSIRREDLPAGRPVQRPRADGQRRPGPVSDLRREPGRLSLDIEPADASVYLDGRFVGTSQDIAEGLLIDPGSHVLEVVRPDRRSARWSFDVAPGGEVEQRIELERP